jgi:crotonobetainyl-CoA:carnitine CoA-transferase CaiB-like acyl-CoA transferase
MREENPGIVYCAISGYGQDGPKRDASGHDMNYLGLVGLLGLTGERGGEPVQAAGQIADIGGGALMAAFGILAALRERDGASPKPAATGRLACAGQRGSGEGQLVDVSMADGSLSWLAMVAATYFADGNVPRRGDLPLAGSLICYRPYECADGWVTLGALEPKFWQGFCRGVRRDDLIAAQFERPGSAAHAEVQAIFKARTREQWEAFARENDCCLEPMLELDEALESELVRAREMVVEIEQPGAERAVRLLGLPVKLGRTPGDHARLPGPALGEHTEEVLRDAGYTPAEVAELLAEGAAAGAAGTAADISFQV